MNIGFIGLGVMGRPMAEHLIDAGHTLHLSRVRQTFELGIRYRKDMPLAVDAARSLDLSLPNTAATQLLMNTAAANDDGERDHSALIRTLELLAGGPR